jgi:hypothetical protein
VASLPRAARVRLGRRPSNIDQCIAEFNDIKPVDQANNIGEALHLALALPRSNLNLFGKGAR